jgi:hypothetical protein
VPNLGIGSSAAIIAAMDENPYYPPQSESSPARKLRELGKFMEQQLDDSQKDWLMLAIGLFVVAPLFYFLFYW